MQINRDENNLLTVKWSKLVYGTCQTRYHVKHTRNGNAAATRTFAVTISFKDASGNNSVAVNAEVNGRQSNYSEPKTIDAAVEPTKTNPVVTPECMFEFFLFS